MTIIMMKLMMMPMMMGLLMAIMVMMVLIACNLRVIHITADAHSPMRLLCTLEWSHGVHSSVCLITSNND